MTKNRMHLITLAVVAAVGLTASAALAEGEKVRVATEASFPPFSKTEADGSFTGFELDLGDAVCERAKLDCEWVKQDFDGMIAALLAGKFEFVFSSMSITDERQKVVDFSLPYYNTPSKFVAPKDSSFDISPSGLAGKAVGTYAGSTQDDYLQAKFSDATVRGYENIDQIAADLVAGRVELMFVEALAAEEFLTKEDGQPYAFVGPDYNDPAILGVGAGAMFRKDDTELRDRVNAAIRDVYADGTFDAIAEKYFEINVRSDQAW